MRKIIRKIARAIGIRTYYMVTASAPVAGGGTAIGTRVISVRPWIHDGSMEDICLHFESKGMPPKANIIMIHRLGP